VDEVLSPVSTSISRYSRELSSALLDYAPPGCFVEGIVGASTEEDYQLINILLPGLHGLFKSALTRRDLRTAWQHGFTHVPAGMIHAPSLFAPLRNHDRTGTPNSQIAVTVHDLTAWSHPEFLTPRQVSWTKAMVQRAYKYSDAVVVPTHALAAELESIFRFGERIRVISAAASQVTAATIDARDALERLALPPHYLLVSGRLGGGSGIEQLLVALAAANTELPLLVADDNDPTALLTAAAAAGLSAGRVISLGPLSESDRSIVVEGAELFIYPNLTNGFGIPMLEAFRFGTAVIHAATPSLGEVAGDAGLAVSVADPTQFAALLAQTIDEALDDSALRARLAILGTDRAKLFSWRSSAESVWQLHADL
jgi:glycosyltransferase involved in cell wall biosynthesis